MNLPWKMTKIHEREETSKRVNSKPCPIDGLGITLDCGRWSKLDRNGDRDDNEVGG